MQERHGERRVSSWKLGDKRVRRDAKRAAADFVTRHLGSSTSTLGALDALFFGDGMIALG
jgi:hypothetical protein